MLILLTTINGKEKLQLGAPYLEKKVCVQTQSFEYYFHTEVYMLSDYFFINFEYVLALLKIRRGTINFPYFSIKAYIVTPH